MYIEYFKLFRYKRLMLSNIQNFEWTPKSNLSVILGSNGCGKAQPLDSLIKVPNGWSTMGEMTVGKEVIAKDGTVTKVNGVYPQGVKEIFKLTFADGRTAKATNDHLWKVTAVNSTKVITTEAVFKLLDANVDCYIPLIESTDIVGRQSLEYLLCKYGTYVDNTWTVVNEDSDKLNFIQQLARSLGKLGYVSGNTLTIPVESLKGLRILSIEFDGFAPAQCISIDHPEHLYITNDFVVTHNSSIMEDGLTPLPPRHKNFVKGGIKEFHCTDKSSKYKLKSVYESGTGWHSFIKDNEELNNGHTFKIQEELCYSHFGINREIQEIAVGKIKFTGLTTSKRRELLTRMSPVDLNYAFSVFHNLRQEHRSQKGVMDLLTKRLINENHDTPSENTLTLLKEQSVKHTTRLNQLFSERTQVDNSQYNNVAQPENEFKDIVSRAEAILKTHVVIPDYIKVKDSSDYAEFNNLVKSEQSKVTGLIGRLTTELEKLKVMDSGDVHSLESELKALTAELTQAKAHQVKLETALSSYNGKFPLVRFNVSSDSIKVIVESAYRQWHDLLVTFPVNEDGYYGRAKATEAQDALKLKTEALNHHSSRYINVMNRLRSIKDCTTLECPKCDHKFKPGITRKEYDKLVVEAKALPDVIVGLETEIVKIQEYLEQFKEYYTYVNRFSNLTREFTTLQPLWDYCTSESVMFVRPTEYLGEAIDWYSNTLHYIDLELLTERIRTLEKRIKAITEIDHDAVNYVKQRTLELGDELEGLYVKSKELNLKSEALTLIRRRIVNNIDTILTIEADLANWVNRCTQYRDWLLTKAYDEEIKELQLQLAESTRTLNLLEQQTTTIRTLENEVANATEIHKDLAVLIKAMSPTGGLLGKYLLTFMQGVTSLVNAYISEVWTYSLEVLAAKVEKDELDYNFPINVGDGAVVTDDISEGSESQIDMINFAFKLTILKFLGVEGLPLYIDEFGRTFDEQHKDNLVPFVTNLIDNGLFQQVFYISHFASTHGAFNLAEFVVIESTNIAVPDVYNENVIIG